MNRSETGQLKDRCGLHLSSWSCLPVGWHRLWLGVVNIPSHTVILARLNLFEIFFYIYCAQGQFSTKKKALSGLSVKLGYSRVGFSLCDSLVSEVVAITDTRITSTFKSLQILYNVTQVSFG